MDFLRTGYKATFKWNAQDQHTSQVRWYRAPGCAQVFPGPHRFGSANYSRQIPVESRFGEQVLKIRFYDKGVAPTGVHGTNYCGQAHWGQDGVPVLAFPIASRFDGQPTCCDGPEAGTVACCPGHTLPSVLRVRLSATSGGSAAAEGFTFCVVWDGAAWSAPITLCGLSTEFRLNCRGALNTFYGGTDNGMLLLVDQAPTSCAPLLLYWHQSSITQSCVGPVDVTITP